MNQIEAVLLEKLQQLSAQRRAEVEDFVDFLRSREEGRGLTRAATETAAPSFAKVWENDADAAYDRL